MNRTAAAHILAIHVLAEAGERGITELTDEVAADIIAEAEGLAGTYLGHIADAAKARPALSRVKRAAQGIIARRQAKLAELRRGV